LDCANVRDPNISNNGRITLAQDVTAAAHLPGALRFPAL